MAVLLMRMKVSAVCHGNNYGIALFREEEEEAHIHKTPFYVVKHQFAFHYDNYDVLVRKHILIPLPKLD